MRLLLALAIALASAGALPQAATQAPDVIFVPTAATAASPVTAAKRFGIRAYGIDIDPQRIAEANENARRNGVSQLVQFRRENLFKADFREATVVTLYLLRELNVKLRPRLLAELNGRTIYLWTVPPRKGS